LIDLFIYLSRYICICVNVSANVVCLRACVCRDKSGSSGKINI